MPPRDGLGDDRMEQTTTAPADDNDRQRDEQPNEGGGNPLREDFSQQERPKKRIFLPPNDGGGLNLQFVQGGEKKEDREPRGPKQTPWERHHKKAVDGWQIA